MTNLSDFSPVVEFTTPKERELSKRKAITEWRGSRRGRGREGEGESEPGTNGGGGAVVGAEEEVWLFGNRSPTKGRPIVWKDRRKKPWGLLNR